MNNTILITSFSTWKSHHTSNSSDDLLHLLSERELGPFNFLRNIPVNFELAPQHVLSRFDELRPKVLICCGMAEERTKLNIESRAVLNEQILQSSVDLDKLAADLLMTEISHDAGEFVCNTLYYKTLEHLSSQEESYHSIFVHVPVITEENKSLLVADFISIIERLSVMSFE
ncbi:peptidase C15 [Sulfurovum sp. CS9]|uniref:pyroglutamyl-peptidase I family protein n=1 Tax=Sulfurovum sp. CS9 TaxID=3391146 RepID=UPI0039E7C9FB